MCFLSVSPHQISEGSEHVNGYRENDRGVFLHRYFGQSFRLPAEARDRREEHRLPLLPLPGQGRPPDFEELAKDFPACNVEISDLENENVFRLLDTDEVQRRAAMWTEVKAS